MTTQTNPIIWFEIPVTDLDRAKAFYGYVLGVPFEEQAMGQTQMAFFPMLKDAGGAAGTLVKGEGYAPCQSGTLIYFTTPDIDAALTRAKEIGGKTLTPKTSIGKYGFIGLLQDSEGNHIGLHSRT